MNIVVVTIAIFQVFLPTVLDGRSPPKAGIAFSSHADGAERVALLGDQVHYWRGWARSSPAQPLWGLEPTQALWCDFYFHPEHSNGMLRPQLPWLEMLDPEFNNYLLILNEPDLAFYDRRGQCGADPARSAEIYWHVRQLLPNARLVGPGISHVDYHNNFQWLAAWWDVVVDISGQPPDIYAWDIHNYIAHGPPLKPYDALEQWLNQRGVRNPRFFVSEWAACTPQRIVEMKAAFENDDRILRHYYYDQYEAHWDGPDRCTMLFVEGSQPIQLSELGLAYKYGIVPPAPDQPQWE